jgi:hypothetical protein
VILSQEIINKNGMDDNDAAAVSKAIKSIQARDRKLKKLITVGKDRAIEYYKTLEGIETSDDSGSNPDVSWIFE